MTPNMANSNYLQHSACNNILGFCGSRRPSNGQVLYEHSQLRSHPTALSPTMPDTASDPLVLFRRDCEREPWNE
jgi:hypothetical protein